MEQAAYLDHVRADATALLTAARRAPEADVASCPGWKTVDLVGHTGSVHRWVTTIVQTRADTRVPFPRDFPTEIGPLGDWFAEGADHLLTTLATTDPEALVWNWAEGKASPTRFWFRRMAQETVIHRCDAEVAAGDTPRIDTGLAVDGIDEYVGFVTRESEPPEAPVRGSLTLAPTDAAERWHLRLTPERIELLEAPQPGADQICGPASDLYLWLVHRQPNLAQVVGNGDSAAAWNHIRFG
jgi:uncharacterized protein (TIGR03083 family)